MTHTQLVSIQGRRYAWSQRGGLDPEAVLTLQGWIVRLARAYMHRAAALNMGLDDLVQAGNIGALKAAKTFDPSKGRTFLSWATNRIKDEMRALCRQKTSISIDGYDGAGRQLSEKIPDTTDVAARGEVELEARQVLLWLDKDGRRLLERRFGIGRKRAMSVSMMARERGQSASAVSQRINTAINHIRRQLSNQRTSNAPYGTKRGQTSTDPGKYRAFPQGGDMYNFKAAVRDVMEEFLEEAAKKVIQKMKDKEAEEAEKEKTAKTGGK